MGGYVLGWVTHPPIMLEAACPLAYTANDKVLFYVFCVYIQEHPWQVVSNAVDLNILPIRYLSLAAMGCGDLFPGMTYVVT